MAHLVNRRTLLVEWGQCDPAGIVFNPQYLVIFNACAAMLFARTGLSSSEMRRKYAILGMPMVDVKARFILPCWFDEEVTVESEVSHWGRTSFSLHHRLLKREGLAVDCHERRVWAAVHPEDPRRMKAVPIPREIIASLSDPTGATTCV
jgi:4-hydroxybenzoyl-CoA thioesterase